LNCISGAYVLYHSLHEDDGLDSVPHDNDNENDGLAFERFYNAKLSVHEGMSGLHHEPSAGIYGATDESEGCRGTLSVIFMLKIGGDEANR
jgi:hypothetical protein